MSKKLQKKISLFWWDLQRIMNLRANNWYYKLESHSKLKQWKSAMHNTFTVKKFLIILLTDYVDQVTNNSMAYSVNLLSDLEL